MQEVELRFWRRQFANEVIGESRAIVAALDTLRLVAHTDCTVLVTGETGTGKELFARAAHRASPRSARPFIPVNCAALPESLIETELFGHVKGAFTGAVAPRAGRFMSASGGTLFLDEIGELPLAAQAKLLRVLEERVVSPVGADLDVPVDVRIIAATHRNLEDLVAQGRFRADLYFRLAVVPIHLPALRERGSDIQLIADLCLARACMRTGREIGGIDPAGRAALASHPWPGNIRELAHRIERAALLTRSAQLGDSDLGIPVPQAPLATGSGTFRPQELVEQLTGQLGCDPATFDLRTALENLERQLIDRALSKTGGNRTEAAALLGLNRTTLVEKLRKYAI